MASSYRTRGSARTRAAGANVVYHGAVELTQGTMVTPSLELERLIGEGAMGSVWVAHHRGLDSRVAIKFVARDHRQEARDRMLIRFEREAKSAARIKSPHVVHMYDHGVTEDDGTPYIVMELLEGSSLGTRLRDEGPLDLDELTQVVTQVSKALTKAHSFGIIHRDIKPDNIFLVPNDDDLLVKVLDFGIAKHVEDEQAMTTTGAMLGTPLYMSPELIKSSRDASPSADLWALAVVAYESLTGRTPFAGETVGALFFSICGDPVEPPSSRRKGVPPSLDAWFDKALSQNREERFADAKTLSAAFKEAVAEVETLGELKGANPEPDDGDAAMGTAEFLAQAELDVPSDGIEQDSTEHDSGEQKETLDSEEDEPNEAATLDGAAASLTTTKMPRWGRWAAAATALVSTVLVSGAFFLSRDEPTSELQIEPQPVAAEAPSETALTITCEPVCDEIVVDGTKYLRKDRAEDVLSLSVAYGKHRIRAVKEFHEPQEEVVEIEEESFAKAYNLERSVGKLSPKVIAPILRKNAEPKFQKCYLAALRRDIKLRGEMQLEYVIDPIGKAIDATTKDDFGDDEFRRCIYDVIESARFPAPEGGFVTQKKTLSFRPPRARAKTSPKSSQDFGNFYSPKSLPELPPQQQQVQKQHKSKKQKK
jgi:serine/threonine protein kinase